MADLTPKAASKQVFDVSPPGKSLPSPTTRPVIVTNRPVLQDPMMVSTPPPKQTDSNDSPEVEEPKTTSAVSTRSNLVIKPLNDIIIDPPEEPTPAVGEDAKPVDSETDTTAVATNDEVATPKEDTTPLVDDASAEEVPVAAETPTEAETPPKVDDAEKAAQSDTTDGSEKAKDPTDPTNKIDLAAEEAAKHEAEIQKLVETKQYFLPINSVEKRRAKRLIIIGVVLCLVLAIAWLDVALDAGLLHVGGIKPVTHFFTK